eukprot:CAMPEP_0174261816 /NCGR_PEP_ID=MMETSP0439-20130205/12323_1 /TAXON_ID=0 /ORGANISM="Stereomyxa ramosa, Strain Chinc5" /LENGTH=348 /DNA_ID=CAMNT_0015346399 /DNA_START=31 /DNA_END=1077 /DNA_ORIENTATION=-
MSTAAIQLSQASYVAGQTVQGNVILKVTSPFTCQKIEVKLKGHEEVKFQQREQDGEEVKIVKRHEEHSVLKEHIHFDGASFQVGNYNFPFSYDLAGGLPASFHVKSTENGLKYKAKVSYHVKCSIKTGHGHKIKGEEHLIVGEKPDHLAAPIMKINDKSFAFNKGSLLMKVECERDIYFPGEVIRMKMQMKNESVKKVTGINVKLIRDLRLKAQRHSFSTSTRDEVKLSGIPEASQDERIECYQLPKDVYETPTVSSKLINMSYFLVVECDVPMAFDLEVKFPILITVQHQLEMGEMTYEGYQASDRQSLLGRDGDIWGISYDDQNYHNLTTLTLPENTGECCACVVC